MSTTTTTTRNCIRSYNTTTDITFTLFTSIPSTVPTKFTTFTTFQPPSSADQAADVVHYPPHPHHHGTHPNVDHVHVHHHLRRARNASQSTERKLLNQQPSAKRLAQPCETCKRAASRADSEE